MARTSLPGYKWGKKKPPTTGKDKGVNGQGMVAKATAAAKKKRRG